MPETARGTILMLAAWPHSIAAIHPLVEARLGLALPGVPGRSAQRGDIIAMAVARGRWLLDIAETPVAEALCRDISPESGVTVDLTSARAIFSLTGSHALDVARKLAPIDFDLPANGVGAVIQGGSRHSVGFVMLRQQENKVRIYVDSGYSDTFAEELALLDAEFRAVSLP